MYAAMDIEGSNIPYFEICSLLIFYQGNEIEILFTNQNLHEKHLKVSFKVLLKVKVVILCRILPFGGFDKCN